MESYPHNSMQARTSPGSTPDLSAGDEAGLASTMRFPPETAVRSLAEMAQRDLDAALQLLADRAQYITGASGAAIALRRDGRNDMLCRASTGSNAPELGALLSTEAGLSGESVRTRQTMRCDDAERDLRVNRDVCRQMGIASVVVMPVVNDDDVLGVFELFSGKANAFGVREVSAVQRLSEMVETAVRLARATQSLPERLKMGGTSAAEVSAGEVTAVEDDQILDGEILADIVLQDMVLEEPGSATQEPAQVAMPAIESSEQVKESATPEALKAESAKLPSALPNALAHDVPHALGQSAPKDGVAGAAVTPSAGPETAAPKKPLFWSAALSPAAEAERAVQADQSHVPPVLRSLRKCEACGFPVSASRVLCVECEEKKWRGQLKVAKAGGAAQTGTQNSVAASKSEARAFAAAACAPMSSSAVASHVTVLAKLQQKEVQVSEPVAISGLSRAVPSASAGAEVRAAEFVLSAGLAPSQSWLARNRYMVGVLLVVGLVVAGIILFR